MVERIDTPDPRWTEVDEYVVAHLLPADAALEQALAANAEAGLPEIDVSAAQGKLLQLIARVAGACRILEVGTLGGYSTIWLARALPEHGRLVTLEIDPHHAEIARANIVRAGLDGCVEVITGAAIDSLRRLAGTFDFVFIDADKPSNVLYLDEALRFSRPGTVIVIDNVVREGQVLDAASTDERVRGTRALFERVAGDSRLDATVVQTVGAKKWDGFLLAVVG